MIPYLIRVWISDIILNKRNDLKSGLPEAFVDKSLKWCEELKTVKDDLSSGEIRLRRNKALSLILHRSIEGFFGTTYKVIRILQFTTTLSELYYSIIISYDSLPHLLKQFDIPVISFDILRTHTHLFKLNYIINGTAQVLLTAEQPFFFVFIITTVNLLPKEMIKNRNISELLATAVPVRKKHLLKSVEACNILLQSRNLVADRSNLLGHGNLRSCQYLTVERCFLKI